MLEMKSQKADQELEAAQNAEQSTGDFDTLLQGLQKMTVALKFMDGMVDNLRQEHITKKEASMKRLVIAKEAQLKAKGRLEDAKRKILKALSARLLVETQQTPPGTGSSNPESSIPTSGSFGRLDDLSSPSVGMIPLPQSTSTPTISLAPSSGGAARQIAGGMSATFQRPGGNMGSN